MKIIEQTSEPAWSGEKTCTGGGNGNGGCGAKLLVEAGDLFITTSMSRGATVNNVTFQCPCGVLTDIPTPPQPAYDAALKNGVRKPDGSR
jgi:hypothetical protein